MQHEDDLSRQLARLTNRLDELEKKQEKRHWENSSRLDRIQAAQEHLDECLDEAKSKLFGSEAGRIGVLEVLADKIQELQKSKSEAWGSVKTVVTFLGWIITIIVAIVAIKK